MKLSVHTWLHEISVFGEKPKMWFQNTEVSHAAIFSVITQHSSPQAVAVAWQHKNGYEGH